MDAFLAAALLPGLLINLISESMNQALVPTLIRVRELEGHTRAQELLSSSMLSMCLLLGSVSAAIALAAPAIFPLIASHFPPAKMGSCNAALLRPFTCGSDHGIATNCTAVLNTFHRLRCPLLRPSPSRSQLRLARWRWVLARAFGSWSTPLWLVRSSMRRSWFG